MLDPSSFGLKNNPFSMLPNAEVQHWAGLPETKKALMDVVLSVRPDDVGASEFVVIRGDWGAGKSHALRYFTHDINTKNRDRAIYLSEIMAGGGLSFSALCPGILEQLEGETINHLVQTVKGSVDNCIKQMREESGYSVFSADTAIDEKIPHQDRDMVKSLINTRQVPNLKTDDYSATKLLGSLFRVMTSHIGNDPPAFGAVYLFLDEVESAFEDKATKQVPFFSSLRSLINGVTEHFALVLSFSVPTAVLEAAVPQALKERMTRPYIQCERLTSDGAKKFVKDYLGFVRPNDEYLPPQPYYPFSEAAINLIFERETALVPRRILMHLRRVWERSVRHENLHPGEEISPEMADQILNGII